MNTQCAAILAHLESGKSITALVALDKFGCFRLAARIHELKYAGNAIRSAKVKMGEKWIARYWI